MLLLAFWPFFDFCLSSASHGRTRVSRCETDKRAQRRELGGNVTQAGLVASERPTGVLVVVRQTRPTSDLNEGPARTEKGRTNDEQRAGRQKTEDRRQETGDAEDRERERRRSWKKGRQRDRPCGRFLARQVCFFLLLRPLRASRRRLRISSAGRCCCCCCCWTSLSAASGFPAAAVLAQWLNGSSGSLQARRESHPKACDIYNIYNSIYKKLQANNYKQATLNRPTLRAEYDIEARGRRASFQ